MADEYLIAKATNSLTGFLLAVDGDVEGTTLVGSSDAATEASRRATLWGSLRRVFRITTFLAAQQVKIGDVVGLDLSRYGLTGPALARVVGTREALTGGSLELEVFL